MQNIGQSLSPDGSEPEAVENLIGTEEVAGTPVFDVEGRRLGWIEQVLFDKFTGRATYAVVVAAIPGRQQHPVPWAHMHYVEDRGGYEVEIDGEAFARAPILSGDGSDWSDPELRRKILDYYRRPIAV